MDRVPSIDPHSAGAKNLMQESTSRQVSFYFKYDKPAPTGETCNGSSDFGGRNRHANNWGDDRHLRSKYTGHSFLF
jgi:hypothetical protein